MKKFLIISSYAPPAISGAPLMMRNLLRYFPAHSFAVLTSHAGIDARAKDNYMWLEAKYFYFDTPALTAADNRRESRLQRVKALLKKFWLTKFLAELFFLCFLPISIVRQGRKIIASEKIELLLAYSDSGPALFSTYLLHKLTKKPYYLFFYDLYAGNRLPFLHRALAKVFEPALFRSAKQIFVMSEALAGHYGKKYGKQTVVIHNSIPIPQTRPMLKTLNPPFKIIYTGTIYWAQADAVRNLVKAVEEIAEPQIQLWLYTPHDKKYLNDLAIYESEKVRFASGLPSEMAEIQGSASVLCVLLGFNTGHPLLINTSSPGKTYEYMISGRPILVHAPKESYIAKYAKEHKFAYVVDSDSIEALKEGIARLITDANLAGELINNAWKTAEANHNDRKTAEKFKRYFEHE